MRRLPLSVSTVTTTVLVACVWLLPLLSKSAVAASAVDEQHHHQQQQQLQGASVVYESSWLISDHPDERVCLSEDKRRPYTCSTRGEQIDMELQRGHRYNLGVAQRIDGSETEKEGIREVIALMKEYFFNEVLAKPAYKDIRNKWYVLVTKR